MRGFQTGPATPRKGCLVILFFLLPFIILAISRMFPAGEVFHHYDELDKERQQELKTEIPKRLNSNRTQ